MPKKLRGSLFGGSPLLQQEELDFSPAEKRSLKMGFSRGVSRSQR